MRGAPLRHIRVLRAKPECGHRAVRGAGLSTNAGVPANALDVGPARRVQCEPCRRGRRGRGGRRAPAGTLGRSPARRVSAGGAAAAAVGIGQSDAAGAQSRTGRAGRMQPHRAAAGATGVEPACAPCRAEPALPRGQEAGQDRRGAPRIPASALLAPAPDERGQHGPRQLLAQGAVADRRAYAVKLGRACDGLVDVGKVAQLAVLSRIGIGPPVAL